MSAPERRSCATRSTEPPRNPLEALRSASFEPLVIGIEGDMFRQIIGPHPMRVVEIDLSEEGDGTEWSFVTSPFVAARPLSSRCDFDVRAIRSTSVVVSGRPRLAKTQWVRVDVEIDTTTNEVHSMAIVSSRGYERDILFGSFATIAPPGRSAFVPTVP